MALQYGQVPGISLGNFKGCHNCEEKRVESFFPHLTWNELLQTC